MVDNVSMKIAIQKVIKTMMDGVMDRVLRTDPFVVDLHHASKPLYAALVPDEIFKGSHFERRFVTPFGLVWEKLALIAAKEGIGYGVQGHSIQGTVNSGRLKRISKVLNWLEHPDKGNTRKSPNWAVELAYVLKGKGAEIPVNVMCDIYAEDTITLKKFAFEIKAPLPNSDQTKVSKEKIFKLYCMNPPQIDAAYYALPYNPYGQRSQYNWPFPSRWFNMQEDSVVLIGDEFWETIGGVGTYQSFIEAVNEIAPEYKERIYREYLGIEPPADSLETQLT